MTNLLEARSLSKRFGGVQALGEVSLSIPAGAIYGLIGPNGAGKTTLFNVLTGLYQADSGALHFEQQNILNNKPHRIVQAGIARTFQNIRLFGQMTALENVMVARHSQTKTGVLGAIFRPPAVQKEEADIKRHALALLNYVGLAKRARHQASALSYGEQRRLEIARALATEPKLLALDEPAAGMNPAERNELRTLMQTINADGVTLLLIEHDVKLVMGLCSKVAVLDFGLKIAEGSPAEVQANPAVIAAYLGAASDTSRRHAHA